MRYALPAGLLLALAGAGAHAAPALQATIGNADTSVSIEADADAARLATLALHGGVPWRNDAADGLPASVTVQGHAQPVHWQLDRAASRLAPRHATLVYVSAAPQLRLEWDWQAHGVRGPIEHTIRIRNLGADTIGLPLVPSLRFDWRIAAAEPLQRFWVEKAGDMPSDHGTHADALRDGDSWEGTSSTYARPLPGEPLEMIPYLLVHRDDAAAEGWYLGIEFSGRTHIALQRSGASLRGEAGLNPSPGPYRTQLQPGDTFVTPTVFVGAAQGGADGAGNALRRWVRAVLGNPHTLADPHYPLLVSNSWGSGMAVDAGLARRMIADAHELGLELYHLDAGWFRDVGDWHADPVKFPAGIAAIAGYAHRLGLKFGMWVDWTQAGPSTRPGALSIADPVTRDWLVADPPAGWVAHEPFKGITVDIGVPAARRWAERETQRIVAENHLDMFEHDGYLVAQGSTRAGHPAVAPDPGTSRVYEDSGYVWADGSNSTDVSYHATLAYYAIHAALRRRFPDLLLEVCNDGGRMIDFGSAAHGDYFSITDHYDPLSNRRAFYDASWVLPPAMLEAYVEQWPAPRPENLRYMLRSGMMGWFSLMLDTTPWSAAERGIARDEFALYKSALRPLIRDADLYHVGPRPDGVHWDGIEYYSTAQRRGVLFAFRGTSPDEPVHRFRLAGLDPARRYRVSFHDRGTAADLLLSGAVLLRDGVDVALPQPLSSELVFVSEQR